MHIEKLNIYLINKIRYGKKTFQSLRIKYKLSIIIALIVIAVVITFSVPVLIHQESMLEQKVGETCRISAELLSHNVRDILLCNVTKQCESEGQVQEQIERLIASNLSDLKFAFVIDINKEKVIKPDSVADYFFSTHDLDRLLAFDEKDTHENQDFLEYYHPVKVKVDSTGRRKTIGVVGVGFSREAIQGPIAKTKTLIFTSAFLIIIISVWGIYFLAERMVNRITALHIAARDIGTGNLEISVKPGSKDEVGQLAREFNNMVKQLREKLHMQKFVSKLTIQMIKARSGSIMKLAEGERHFVAILFSDIRNFTSVAEKLEPEQIVHLINVYFHLQTEMIEKNGGIVDKFMGDQIMAIFPTNNMLSSAISAAVAIQRGIRDVNQSRRQKNEVILEVGIGINHGRAVLGNMGHKLRMDYTVIGDVVNIAARLCSIAKAGQIIASMEAVKNLNGKYPTTRLQPIIVKGRSRPIDICEVDYDRDVIM
ncbi:MAG: adenylate/guanylate cyclase domain-containing protein [bacterium]